MRTQREVVARGRALRRMPRRALPGASRAASLRLRESESVIGALAGDTAYKQYEVR